MYVGGIPSWLHPKNGQFHAFLDPHIAHTNDDITGILMRKIVYDIHSAGIVEFNFSGHNAF